MKRVAVATITWVRSASEEWLLRRSLGHLADTGLPIAVADAGTSAAFAAFLRGLPNCSVTAAADGGLVPQVRASLARAATFGRQHILYTEPDKDAFFQERIHDFLRAAPDGHDGGVVVAARSAASFETFPRMQRYTEGVINELCGMVLGVAGDYSYGPFLMHDALLPEAERLEARLGWGWRHRMFVHAARERRSVVHLAGDHPCPPDQRTEDDAERAHRLRQLSQNILGLVG